MDRLAKYCLSGGCLAANPLPTDTMLTGAAPPPTLRGPSCTSLWLFGARGWHPLQRIQQVHRERQDFVQLMQSNCDSEIRPLLVCSRANCCAATLTRTATGLDDGAVHRGRRDSGIGSLLEAVRLRTFGLPRTARSSERAATLLVSIQSVRPPRREANEWPQKVDGYSSIALCIRTRFEKQWCKC